MCRSVTVVSQARPLKVAHGDTKRDAPFFAGSILHKSSARTASTWQNPSMDMNNPAETRQRILRYWWMLELFSPQKVPEVPRRSSQPKDRQVIEWEPREALPWEVLRPPPPVNDTSMKWQHTVYLGVYGLEEIYQDLHYVFAEDQDAYDERTAGLSACAAVMLDERGALMVDSATLSSALWAVARIRSTREVPSPHWGSGFAQAAEDFTKEVDAFEGDRREAADTEQPPAQDADSLQELLRIAHKVSGIAGVPVLASERIIISSVAVSSRRADDTGADIDFLNSFFLDDLTTVARGLLNGGCPRALSEYLTADAKVPVARRVDVIRDDAAADAGVRVDQLPKGRWPSNPEHGLALRQQFAVNRALGDLAGAGSGLMGVNGPPGTGKTTMLRDILAGNVVERARRLAELKSPDDAFTATTHCWQSGDGFRREVRQLQPALTGFEMVVASANNAAVENISVEIPALGAIDRKWRESVGYFADIASATLASSEAGGQERENAKGTDRKAWGLVAARLGSKRNRAAFRSAFWFDVTDRDKKRIPGTAPRMQTRLNQWRDGKEPYKTWPQARADFCWAERRVDELIAQREAAQWRMERLKAALREEMELAAQAQRLTAEATEAANESQKYANVVERAQIEYSEAGSLWNRHAALKPGVLETLFTLGRAIREWRERLKPLEERLRIAEQNWQQVSRHAQSLDERTRYISGELASFENRRRCLSQEVGDLRQQVSEDCAHYGSGYPDEGRDREDREKNTPWLDAELDAARSDLFLAALGLHEDFLANAARDMVKGLRAAIEVVAGAYPRNLEPEKIRAAWQTFFLVVPMVSTTFASFGRMFAGLGPESLGWLLIDEAGQACPQYAVGGIWRSRRVVAVGDPLQLQPVVTMPRKAQYDIAAAFGVSPVWIPPLASVQTLADRVSHYGTTLHHGEKPMWVSAPLTVHRRCDDPMFRLCNEIAYGSMMVSGVQRRLDDPDNPDLFDDPHERKISPSHWIDVPARTPGTHLQDNQIEELRKQIEQLQAQGVAMSQIIAISPFRVVANALGSLRGRYPGLRGGTIHTVQGREADVVFLVLGGDPGAPGAKAWASSTVNLVNVAASRAKRRLYVIGDRAAWSQYPYFADLASVLPSEPQSPMGTVS